MTFAPGQSPELIRQIKAFFPTHPQTQQYLRQAKLSLYIRLVIRG